MGQPAPRRLSAEDFEGLFSALPTPYVVLDLDLVIVTSNLAFTATTGRSSEVLVGRGLFEAFPPTPDALDEQGRIRTEMLLRRVAETGQAESSPVYRHDIAGRDGELLERHWLVTAAPVLDADGRMRLLVQRVRGLSALGADGGALLQGLAAQCAQAVLRIETSQRERREVGAVRRLAEELQHALLTPPPEPDHLHVVVLAVDTLAASRRCAQP